MLHGSAPRTTYGAYGRPDHRVVAGTRLHKCVLGLAAAVLMLAIGTDARAADAQRLIREILGSGSYQCHLPGSDSATDPVAAEVACVEPAARPVQDDVDPMRPDPWEFVEPEPPASTIETGQFFRVLLWTVIITGVALLTIEVARRLQSGSGRQRELSLTHDATASMGEPSADQPEADRDFATADALAETGAWSKAIHALLLAALLRLPERLGNAFPTSWTGRELLNRVPMPDDPAEDLAYLVRASETAHFAGRPASQTDYAVCRERSLRVLQWAGAN